LVTAYIYIEGDSEAGSACREAFRKLLKSAGFEGKMPRLVASGGRNATFDDFRTKLKQAKVGDFVAMLVDSEDPIANVEETWKHLKARDDWDKPAGAVDEQVLLMTTCMETWIVADPETLKSHYGQCLQVSALPSLVNLENRHRHDVQDALTHATRNCSKAYAKGKRSFEVLAVLNPSALEKLPSFARMVRILKEKLC